MSNNLSTVTQSWLSQSDALDVICNHVSCGGSLVGLCQANKLNYSTVARWVQLPENIQRWLSAVRGRQEWAQEQILHELAVITQVDIRDLYDAEGQIRSPSQWPDALAKCVQSCQMTETFDKDGNPVRKYTVRMYDKLKAIELWGRERGMFKDKVEIGVDAALHDILSRGSRNVERYRNHRAETVDVVNTHEAINTHKESGPI